MKYVHTALKVLLGLLIVMPIIGMLGIFPRPTPDMYTTAGAFAFIDALFNASYVMYMMAIVCALALVLLCTKRTAVAALLLLPVTTNIIAFHAFLDGGIFTAGSVMADVLFAINLYFIWKYRALYAQYMRDARNAE